MINIEKTQILKESESATILTPPRWLRIPDAVKYAGLGRSTIYNLLGQGKIKSCTIGSIRVVDRESIDSFMENQSA